MLALDIREFDFDHDRLFADRGAGSNQVDSAPDEGCDHAVENAATLAGMNAKEDLDKLGLLQILRILGDVVSTRSNSLSVLAVFAACAAMSLHSTAQAGAWTPKAGEAYHKLAVYHFSSDRFFDARRVGVKTERSRRRRVCDAV